VASVGAKRAIPAKRLKKARLSIDPCTLF